MANPDKDIVPRPSVVKEAFEIFRSESRGEVAKVNQISNGRVITSRMAGRSLKFLHNQGAVEQDKGGAYTFYRPSREDSLSEWLEENEYLVEDAEEKYRRMLKGELEVYDVDEMDGALEEWGIWIREGSNGPKLRNLRNPSYTDGVLSYFEEIGLINSESDRSIGIDRQDLSYVAEVLEEEKGMDIEVRWPE